MTKSLQKFDRIQQNIKTYFDGILNIKLNSKLIFKGSIFEEDSNYEDVFKYAIERINKMNQNHLNLVPLSEMLHSSDGQKPLTSLNITCNLLGTNTFGIVGPKDIDNINVVQSVCDEKEVPHILYRWIHKPPRSGTIINLYPHAEILSKVYFDIISAWNWKTFTILYENNESLLRLADLIQVAKEKEIVVIIRQLVLSLDLGYRYLSVRSIILYKISYIITIF